MKRPLPRCGDGQIIVNASATPQSKTLRAMGQPARLKHDVTVNPNGRGRLRGSLIARK
jgi:hypothetical protein